MMTKGGGGVSQKVTKDDEGGGKVWKPPKLTDIICEQPLTGDSGESGDSGEPADSHQFDIFGESVNSVDSFESHSCGE